jgi:hypothetical protein
MALSRSRQSGSAGLVRVQRQIEPAHSSVEVVRNVRAFVPVLKRSRRLKTFTTTAERTKRFGARGSPADHPLQSD